MLHSREILRDFAGAGPRAAWIAAFALPVAAFVYYGHWAPWHAYFTLLAGSYAIAAMTLSVAAKTMEWPAPFLCVAAAAALGVLGGAAVMATFVRTLDWTLAAGWAWWLQNVALAAGFSAVLVAPTLLTRRAEQLRHHATEESHERELQRQKQMRQVAQLELKALQAQIEPHFLYNTLANVQHLLRTDPAAADRMLESLIRYLKTSLPQIRAGHSTVGEELARVEAYLAIMQVRMQSRLRYDIAVPEELCGVALPPLSLLTLVENAVKHGLEPRTAGGEIRIEGRREAGSLELAVSDDGVGFHAESGAGIGLTNLRDRLRALHGPEAALDLSVTPCGGVEARLRIPCAAEHAA